MRLVLGWAVLGLGGLAGAADLEQVRARGALRVIVAADESAETFALTPGPDPGFERELIESFARVQGVPVEVVTAQGYADRIPMLLKGDGDVIVAIFDTEDRRRQVDFTAEVMPTHNVAVNLKPAAAVSDIAALKALPAIGAIKGAKPAEAASAAGVAASALRLFETRDGLLQALRAKQVAAVVLPVSELALAAREFPDLQAGVTVGAPGRVAWAVRKEDAALRAALDEHLLSVRRGATWSRLIVKYFGDQVLAVLGRR
ncbi:MAG TPA: transporter substrate-binding domain-containing protein [Vicinamibacteria bacterium]|nr:transporter substrate-binding domain-containing protein [Vicinamibacteria bacterium]